MRRREVLAGIGTLALAACRSQGLRGIDLQFTLPEPPRVWIDTRRRLASLRHDALGLSLEMSRLADPTFVSAQNLALVGRVRNLIHGMLCVGGHSADRTLWQAAGGPAAQPPYRQVLDETAIGRLAGFLDATDSRLVYSIDFAHGDPGRAVQEAGVVVRHVGTRLAALQFGHAPDLYVDNRWRPERFGAPAYAAAWVDFAHAVRAGVPGVPLVGPEVIGPQRVAWVSEFIAQCGELASAVTFGEYQEAPRATLSGRRRRASDSKAPPVADSQVQQIVDAARARGLPAWITQAAWLERGDPRDTLEAALWAIQTFYTCHEQGVGHVSFDAGRRIEAGPLYHGLKLVEQTLGSQRVATSTAQSVQNPKAHADARAPENLHAWAMLDARERVQLVLVNRDRDHSTDVRVAADRRLSGGTILRLTGPGYDARDQVAFAGATVDAAGRWQPQYTETVQWVDGTGWLTVGAASAVLVLFE